MKIIKKIKVEAGMNVVIKEDFDAIKKGCFAYITRIGKYPEDGKVCFFKAFPYKSGDWFFLKRNDFDIIDLGTEE